MDCVDTFVLQSIELYTSKSKKQWIEVPQSEQSRSEQRVVHLEKVNTIVFFMFALLRRTSIWPPCMGNISVIILHILQTTIINMLDLCRQLSCTASTPVFLTCGYFCFNVSLNLIVVTMIPGCKLAPWTTMILVQSFTAWPY